MQIRGAAAAAIVVGPRVEHVGHRVAELRSQILAVRTVVRAVPAFKCLCAEEPLWGPCDRPGNPQGCGVHQGRLASASAGHAGSARRWPNRDEADPRRCQAPRRRPPLGGPGHLLADEVERTARALAAAGYFGPFGIDGFSYRQADGGVAFNPRCEINARFTMGYPRSLLLEALGQRG